MSPAEIPDVPRVCAREGCDTELSGRQRKYCSTRCRRLAEKDRRLARAREATAAALAETKGRVLEMVKEFYYVSAGAQAAGVARSTVYGWIDTDPEFAAGIERARLIASDMREIAVLDAAQRGDRTRVLNAMSVCQRIDANEARRRRAAARRQTETAPEIPTPDCAEQLDWARRPRLEAV